MKIQSMAELQLPRNADRILTRASHSVVSREGTKMMVYGLSNTVTSDDVEHLSHDATRSYQELEATGDSFVSSAPQAIRLPGAKVQEVLDAHIALSNHPNGADMARR